MFSLSQDDRQMIKEQHVNQRTTRQNDSKKRNTNNSLLEETTSPYYLKDNLMPKKQKIYNNDNNKNSNNNNYYLNISHNNKVNENITMVNTSSKQNDKNNSFDNNKENSTSQLKIEKYRESIHQTKLFTDNDKEKPDLTLSESDKEKSDLTLSEIEDKFPAKLFKDGIVANVCKSNVAIEKTESLKMDISKYNFENETSNILGVGHIHLIHLFTRDFLFKKIKILSDHHLERQGEIIKKVMEKLHYSERINGNYIAFTNAVRTEIRKTMCAKRGYVKRQIGLLLKGMIIILHLKSIDFTLSYIFAFKIC